MDKCTKCIYYPKCDECPFDESGCEDFIDSSEFAYVVHGQWLIDYTTGINFCSVCNCDTVEAETAYCASCGAKMDLEDDD